MDNSQRLTSELTKREHFAVTILSGLVSFSHEENVPNNQNLIASVQMAVKVTNWLLEELEKQPTQKTN